MGAARGTARARWKTDRPRTLIFSCLRDKPVAEMAQILFPLFEQVIVTPIHAARAAAVEDLLAAAKATGTTAIAAESVRRGVAHGAGERSGRSGGGLGIGVPGGRGAGELVARMRRRERIDERTAQSAAAASIAGERMRCRCRCCAGDGGLRLTALAVSLVDKKGRVQHWIARFWARAVVWALAVAVKVQGTENLRKQPVAVYASNHTSYMDTPVIFAALPFQFRILAKKELVADGRSSAGIWIAPDKCRLILRTRMRRSRAWAVR